MRTVLLPLLLAALTVHAQDAATNAPARTSERLDLRKVIELATERNLDIELAREKVRSARGDLLVSRSHLLPELNASAKQTRQDRSVAAYGLPETTSVTAPAPAPFRVDYNARDSVIQRLGLPTGGSVTLPDPLLLEFDFQDTTGVYNFFDGKLSLSVPLLDLQNLDSYRAVRTALDRASLDIRAAAESVVLQATLLYYGVLVSEEAIRAGEEKVNLHEDKLKTARDMRAAGEATDLDIQKEEAALASVRSELLASRNELAMALRGLQKTLRLEAPPTALEGQLGFQPVATVPAEEAVQTALARRPDFQQQQKSEKIAVYQRNAVRGSHYPTFSAFGSYGFQGNLPDDANEAWQVGVGAQLPIWDSFRRRGDLLRAESSLAQVRNRKVDLESTIRTEIQNVIDELNYRADAIRVARLNYNVAELNVQLEQDKKDAGTAKLLDLQNAEVNRAQAEYRRIQAYYEYATAAVAWFHAIGDTAGVLTLPPPERDVSPEK